VIATRGQARAVIARYYGEEFAKSVTFRPHGCNVFVRPSYETTIGLPTLCSRKLAPGKDATIWLGQLLPGGQIDWNWTHRD
jgi:hypothetical protein